MNEPQATPVKDALADPGHPAHEAVKNVISGLENGTLSMCACMGPQCGEPYCPCEMNRRGLQPSAERVAANAEANKQFQALVESGVFSQ